MSRPCGFLGGARSRTICKEQTTFSVNTCCSSEAEIEIFTYLKILALLEVVKQVAHVKVVLEYSTPLSLSYT